MHSILQYSYY